LSDGTHSIDKCLLVTQKVLAVVFKALHDNNIFFEGMLLKPNMVSPGSLDPNRASVSAKEIGEKTVIAMLRTVVPAVPGIMFLSGG